MKKVRSACVYCGTGSSVAAVYKNAAADLGILMAKQNIRLVYGGGRVGLMGIVSEGCFKNGGEVVGIIPEHIQAKEIRNDDLTELHVVDSMHTRKKMMVDKSDAFIVLPGGFGTLDETFEVLTWKYLKLHDKPIVIVNVNGYYDPMLQMIDHMAGIGFTPGWHKELYHVVETPAAALAVLDAEPENEMEPNLKRL